MKLIKLLIVALFFAFCCSAHKAKVPNANGKSFAQQLEAISGYLQKFNSKVVGLYESAKNFVYNFPMEAVSRLDDLASTLSEQLGSLNKAHFDAMKLVEKFFQSLVKFVAATVEQAFNFVEKVKHFFLQRIKKCFQV